ncbi:MAG: GAF domain-containing protein [Cyanobacteria bacterium P01_A01_bin.135]
MVAANSSNAFTRRLWDHLHENMSPAQVMEAILPYLGQQLRCDRIFVYLRCPETRQGRVPFCWRHSSEIPLVYDPHWKPEPEGLGDEDPMFAAALALEPSIFVEDVETASPNVLNRKFEAENFGHRALVHAHLGIERQLWGVLQPSMFDRPRKWNAEDRALVQRAAAWLTPLAMEYVLNSPNHDC